MTEQKLDIAATFCAYGAEDFAFRIGIIGTGSGFKSIIDFITSTEYSEYLPPMVLTAVAQADPDPARLHYLDGMAVPVHPDWQAMLKAHPEINLVVELTGKHLLPELRRALPPHISLVDHGIGIFFCCLHNLHQVTAHCQVDLNRKSQLLQTVMEKVREDVLVLDTHYRVVDMNQSVAQRLGRDKEALLGLPCWEVQTLPGGEPFCLEMDAKCPVAVTLKTREKAEALLTRVNPDGHLLYFREYSYPVLDAAGGLSHVLVMRRDITARTYQEKAQQEREKLAVLGEMAMYLAHEIRNPLCAIGGFTSALMHAPELSERSLEKLKIVSEETERLEGMLTNILKFTRPSKTMVEDVDLNPLAENTVELTRIGYEKAGFRFRTEHDPALPLVQGNAALFTQALMNLLQNAIEAMPSGGEIVIATGLAGDMAYLSVKDTGVGMSKKDIERAFSPFYTTKPRGLGLGLSLIKKAMEEIGGRVDLVSVEGAGTTVTLFVPPILETRDQDRAILSI